MAHGYETGRLNLPFVGICTFAKAPYVTALAPGEADVAILGAPFDFGTQWRAGARFGPRSVREASTLFSFGHAGAYDHEDDSYICPAGNRLRRSNRNFSTPRSGIEPSISQAADSVAAVSAASAGRRRSASRSAASVGVMRPACRRNSAAPSARSRSETRLLTTDFAMFSRAAAAVSVPSSITARKVSISSRV